MDCPKCKEECNRDEVDVGVGVIYGPWGCAYCGWSECDIEQMRKDYPDRYVDQFGGVHSIDRIVETCERFGLDGSEVRKAFEE